jgi:hypothetical protein
MKLLTGWIAALLHWIVTPPLDPVVRAAKKRTRNARRAADRLLRWSGR